MLPLLLLLLNILASDLECLHFPYHPTFSSPETSKFKQLAIIINILRMNSDEIYVAFFVLNIAKAFF